MVSRDDTREEFAKQMSRQMPPEPGEDALERVRARACSDRRAGADRGSWPRVSRVIGGAVGLAAAIAVALLVLAPRVETGAFARERAADALLLQTDGRVLHAVLHYTETGRNEREGRDRRYDLDQQWSFWIDPEGERVREEFVNVADGSLDNLSVRVGDRLMVFQNNVRYPRGGAQQLIDEDVTGQPIATAMGTIIDYMRARIADGSAKVTGVERIDGDEYWVVEWRSEDEGIAVRVTMRKSDYRLKTWEQDITYENEQDGKGIQEERFYFETLEYVDPDSLGEDFFSLDAVVSAAKPGTPIEKR